MFRKGHPVRVINYFIGWDDNDCVVESYDNKTDTYTVRRRTEPDLWDIPANYVHDAKGQPTKTSFTIVSEWEGDREQLGIGSQWAGSVDSALEMHHAAMETARPGRNFKIIAVMPSRVYDALPSNVFGKVEWSYTRQVAQL